MHWCQLSISQPHRALCPVSSPVRTRQPAETFCLHRMLSRGSGPVFAINPTPSTGTHTSREDRGGREAVTRPHCPSEQIGGGSALNTRLLPSALLATFFFCPRFHPCLNPLPLLLLVIKKKVFFFFPNKQDGLKLCNLPMYEINIIPNEALGKCSPVNLAEDYGGKKKS